MYQLQMRRGKSTILPQFVDNFRIRERSFDRERSWGPFSWPCPAVPLVVRYWQSESFGTSLICGGSGPNDPGCRRNGQMRVPRIPRNHDRHVAWLVHQYALSLAAAEAEAVRRYRAMPTSFATWNQED